MVLMHHCRELADDSVSVSRTSAGSFQLLNGFAYRWIEPITARIEMRVNGMQHPRIPEFLDVISRAFYGRFRTLTAEECADLVCHADKSFGRITMRHAPGPFAKSVRDAAKSVPDA